MRLKDVTAADLGRKVKISFADEDAGLQQRSVPGFWYGKIASEPTEYIDHIDNSGRTVKEWRVYITTGYDNEKIAFTHASQMNVEFIDVFPEDVLEKEHNCELMSEFLEDGAVPIEYNARFREYFMPISGQGTIQLITHCPWCGAKLPEPLRDAFFDELEEQGIDYSKDKLPKKYISDAWWKDK